MKGLLRRALRRGWLILNRSPADRRDEFLAWWDARRGYPRLHKQFRRRVGYDLNRDAPRTINEKVQWRKIHDRRPVYRTLADKYAVRGFVAKRLGKERAESLFPRLLGVTMRPTEAWLRQFGVPVAFKANHGSGWNVFLRPGDTPDYPAILRQLRGWLRKRYGWRLQEWAYWGITPRIIAEELLQTPDGRVADDIKLWMYRGKCRHLQLDHDRFGSHSETFMTPDWQPVPMRMRVKGELAEAPRPAQLDQMIAIAEELSRGLDFIRVDFLYTTDRFALNELTLYRGSGLTPFHPRRYDRKLGAMWVLPRRAGQNKAKAPAEGRAGKGAGQQ